MNVQIFLVVVCIGLAVCFVVYKLIKQFDKKKQDDCGCGKCG